MIDYRDDINGLRAIAVLLVIFNHLGFLPGGFLGVDIFFVISGYLITAIIRRDYQKGIFNISFFLTKRFMRLFPALAIVIIFIAIVGGLLFEPSVFKRTGREIASASIFTSNFWFWMEGNDYFGGEEGQKLLLHSWSLGVEGQFYFIYPFFLFIGSKISNENKRLFLFVLVVLVSFFVAEWMSGDAKNASFYLLPTRFWEFLVGGLLALRSLKVRGKLVSNVMAMLGMFLIVFSAVAVNSSWLHPGFVTLYPVLGTAFVIFAGETVQNNYVSELFRNKLIAFIGVISYSLYLWHWPILQLYRIFKAGELEWFDIIVFFLITLVFSYLSWKFVEEPFRKKKGTLLVMALLFVALILSSLGFYINNKKGMPERFDVKMYESFSESASVEFNLRCFNGDIKAITDSSKCMLGAEQKAPDYIVWGDSHARALVPGLDELAKSAGLSIQVARKAGCPPVRVVGQSEACRLFNDKVFQYIESNSNMNVVILAAKWNEYQKDSVMIQSFKELLKKMNDKGKTVYFVEQVPQLNYNLRSLFIRDLFLKGLGVRVEPNVCFSQSVYDQQKKDMQNVLLKLQAISSLKIISFDEILCAKGCCTTSKKNYLYYQDDNHLSDAGSVKAAEAFKLVLTK